jgi:hypothetical protein
MKDLLDSERLPRPRNRKSAPPCKRFEVLSGLADWEADKASLLEEESETIEACPPTLPSGESPRQLW